MTQLGILIPQKRRFDNIDLLRAIAIIPVILFHYTTRFSLEFYKTSYVPFHLHFGKFGVDLFFVVSGYCIFLTLDSSHSLSNFWAKRLARLQPAYTFSILVTSVVVATFGLPDREESHIIALANIFWLNTIPTIPHVDGVYWSLIVELKFYFFIGIIYWISNGKNVSFWWATFCIIAMIIYYYFQIVGEWILIAPYAPAFLIGLLAYESSKVRKSLLAILLLLSLLLVGLSPRFAEAPWLGVAIAIFGYSALQMNWLRVPKPITYVGLVSYPLYLIHDNLGLILIRSLDVLDMSSRIIITVLASIALAAAINRTVEIRWQKPLASFFQSLIDGAWGRLPRPKHYRLGDELRRW